MASERATIFIRVLVDDSINRSTCRCIGCLFLLSLQEFGKVDNTFELVARSCEKCTRIKSEGSEYLSNELHIPHFDITDKPLCIS